MGHAATFKRAQDRCIQKLSTGSDDCQSLFGSASNGNYKVVLRFSNFRSRSLIKFNKKDTTMDMMTASKEARSLRLKVVLVSA